MRQSAGGTGDNALQTPSWRPEEEGGSQDVRAAFPLSPSPVSWVLVLGLGRTPRTPLCTQGCSHPGQETPGFGRPVERGAARTRCLGRERWGGGDGDPRAPPSSACMLLHGEFGVCFPPTPPPSPAWTKIHGDGQAGSTLMVGTGWKSGQGLRCPPLQRGLLSAGRAVGALTTSCGGIFRGVIGKNVALVWDDHLLLPLPPPLDLREPRGGLCRAGTVG